MTLITLALMVAAYALTAALPLEHRPGDSGSLVPLSFAAYAPLGSLIASRRPGNGIGWLLAVVGLAWSIVTFGSAYVNYDVFVMPLPAAEVVIWSTHLWIVSSILLPLAILVFPDGRLPSSRWRPAAWWLVTVLVIGFTFSNNTIPPLDRPEPPGGRIVSPPPFLTDQLRLFQMLSGVGFLSAFALAASGIAVRLRGAGFAERQQLKWIVYSSVLVMSGMVALSVIWLLAGMRDPITGDPTFVIGLFFGIPAFLLLLTLPVSAVIAILRYRLFDIDVLVNRTVVYGAATATLLTTYAVTVILLQQILSRLTLGNDVAIAASTLLIAALFQPVRYRVQELVDRRFYRRKYDAAKTVAAFSAHLRQDIDLDSIVGELTAVAYETVQPAHASVWLRSRAK